MRIRCSIHFIIFLLVFSHPPSRLINKNDQYQVFRGARFKFRVRKMFWTLNLGRALGPIGFLDFGAQLEMKIRLGAKLKISHFSPSLTRHQPLPISPFPKFLTISPNYLSQRSSSSQSIKARNFASLFSSSFPFF